MQAKSTEARARYQVRANALLETESVVHHELHHEHYEKSLVQTDCEELASICYVLNMYSRSLRRWAFCWFVCSFVGSFLSCVCDLFRFDKFLWRSNKNAHTVFRMVNPVQDMHMILFKVNEITKQAKYQ